jgi:iron(III) transport system permease protein
VGYTFRLFHFFTHDRGLPAARRQAEAAAGDLGASGLTVFPGIVLPLTSPSQISAMLLFLSRASRELVACVVAARVGIRTIAAFIWRQFEQGTIGLGMAMALVILRITRLYRSSC